MVESRETGHCPAGQVIILKISHWSLFREPQVSGSGSMSKVTATLAEVFFRARIV